MIAATYAKTLTTEQLSTSYVTNKLNPPKKLIKLKIVNAGEHGSPVAGVESVRSVLFAWVACIAIGRCLHRSLGEAGEIEPETDGMLIEYNIDTDEFTEEVFVTVLCPQHFHCAVSHQCVNFFHSLGQEFS